MVRLTKEEQEKIQKEHELRIKKELLGQIKQASDEVNRGLERLADSNDLTFINDGVPELYASLCELKNAAEHLLTLKVEEPEPPKVAA